MKCREKCQRSPAKCGAAQTACEDKVIAKFDGGLTPAKGCFAKLEAKDNPTKPDSVCTTTGDTGALDALADGAVATLVGTLEGTPPAVCGNGTLESGEQCDVGTLNGESCATRPGFVGGTLRCSAGCTFDTSGCYATRFVDNGDGTVTDNQTGLQWEQKTTTVGSGTNDGDDHDVDNTYSYSEFIETIGGIGFLDFLNGLSLDGTTMVNCFAGHCDWRLPTIVELQTILLAPYPCGTTPCIDPIFGPTAASAYWSSTTYVTYPDYAWVVGFDDGGLYGDVKSGTAYVRAVRGGL